MKLSVTVLDIKEGNAQGKKKEWVTALLCFRGETL
jgi:hypothetical protein